MSSKKKILIIDDDPKNIFALRLTLEAKGYECLTASDADEGLEMAAKEEISVVLMDIMMPDKDGFQAIAEMRDRPETAQTPIIAVTAQAMLGDREKCLEAGANGYVSKPINVDELLTLLNTYTL